MNETPGTEAKKEANEMVLFHVENAPLISLDMKGDDTLWGGEGGIRGGHLLTRRGRKY